MIWEGIWPILGGGLTTLFVCVALVATKHLHGRMTLDTASGVHKFHTNPTPRIGGVGIMAGCLCSWLLFKFSGDPASPRAIEGENLFGLMLLAGIPAFLFGILEDLTKRVGVTSRLMATMSSGILAWWLTSTSISHVDIPGIDSLLAILPISVAFTAFAVGGVANSFNIIDGFNGLAAGTLIIALGSMGLIAVNAGDTALAIICLTILTITFGFAVVNFPLGKIFLGDGGAYLLGFLTAWIAVMLPTRDPTVSPWAPLLACSYPILEVLFSIWRKHNREGSHPGQPDKVHLHMLLYRRISKHKFANATSELQNGLTSIFAWLFAIAPACMAVIISDKTPALVTAFLIAAVLYRIIYVRITQFSWKAATTGRFVRYLPKQVKTGERRAA